MNTHRIIIVVVFITLFATVGYFFRSSLFRSDTHVAPGKLTVTTSFYPLYFLANAIGGDIAYVRNMTPSGTEPHDYEPTPEDLRFMTQSALVFVNGAGLESWGTKNSSLLDPKRTRMVTIGDIFEKLTISEDGQMRNDPHFWLSPRLAKEMAKQIADAMIVADPTNTLTYRTNKEALSAQLEQLDKEFKDGLTNCTRRDFVTSHNAFGYLAQEYNLKQIAVAGLAPQAEPSPKQMAEIADDVRKNGITVIFFEQLVSPKLSQTLAEETHTSTLVLDPIEGISDADVRVGKNYFSIMRENLTHLQTALGCTQ